MNILIVDGDPIDNALINEMLKQTEHVLYSATTGREALATIREASIDLILLDIKLKDMTGHDVAKKIRAQFNDIQITIIFIASMDDGEKISHALDFGDDFIMKPIDFTFLKNKIENNHKKVTEHKKILQEHNDLMVLQKEFDHEKNIVKEIFSNIVKRNKITGTHLKFIVTPKSVFGGDIILTHQVDSITYLLVGDFSGHGLPAAIGLLPTANTFFTMVKKKLSVSLIANEINRSLLLNLPDYMLLSASIVAYDTKAHTCCIWSGGMPEAILTDKNGNMKNTIHPQHMALGALSVDEFDDATTEIEFNGGDNLFLYTNGLVDAKNADGDVFGQERFLNLFQQNDRFVFQTILTEMNNFTQHIHHEDDISLAEITFV